MSRIDLRFLTIGLILIIMGVPSIQSAQSTGDLPKQFRSIFGLMAGQISFEQVENKLGKADWWETDSELKRAQYAKSMCYQATNGTLLVVTTDSPDKGTPVDIIELVAPGSRYPRAGRCLSIAREKTIQTAGGLKTGLTFAQVKQLLGKPQQSASGQYTWHWDAYSRIEPSEKSYDYWNSRRVECFEGMEPF